MQPQILGQETKLFLVDTKSDKIEAANAVSRLIEKEKVAAIIGEVISSDTLAGVPIAERAKIPNIAPTAQPGSFDFTNALSPGTPPRGPR